MSKASHLQKLLQAGFNVPQFVLLPSEIFDEFCSAIPKPLTAEKILGTGFDNELTEKISAIIQPLLSFDVAIRSSMQGEDSVLHSYAGQLDSFLNIRNADAMFEAIKKCWASAYGQRAVAYRKENNLPNENIKMEVIVQVMVPAEISGVIFTADPVAKDPRWMMISVAEGLGEALVQGQTAGETVRVSRIDGEIQGQITILKRVYIEQIKSLAEKIESLFGTPQDIEFAIVGDEISILQARPITSKIYTEYMLWDNSNITESYSGVTTPLTFSVIRGSYANVYRQFLSLMGVRHMDEVVLQKLLGFYNGQVYYQLLNWYQALSWLPAFEQNKKFLEQMMGVKQSAKVEDTKQAGGKFALFVWALRMIALHNTSEKRALDFLSDFNAVLKEYHAKNFEKMTPHELHLAYLDLEARVLGNWRAPILNDFLAMIFFGILRRLSERWFENGSSLHNDLLAGDGQIESLEPAKQVQKLAQQVRENLQLRNIFTLAPQKILHEIRDNPEFAEFHKAFNEYLMLYGDRCMNELKLEEPNLRDDPIPFIKVIVSAVNSPVNLENKPRIREDAEARIYKQPFYKRVLFNWVVKHTRRYIRNRENLRFARSRLFGLLRGVFNSLGKQWGGAGVLESPKDIYYLTAHEIWDFVTGTAVTQNLKALVDLRRKEFEAHRMNSTPLPDRFETFGIPYLDSPRDLLAKVSLNGNVLQGTGCCSGIVTGKTQVVQSIDGMKDLGGNILVAERTDPGWVFLYPSASGILVERGSPLSHSAIVAREMGKPIIVNIPHLTKRVKTGDTVQMDGGRGIVNLL